FRLDDEAGRQRALARLFVGSEIIAPAKVTAPADLTFCHTLVRDFFAAMYLTRSPSRVGELLRPSQLRNLKRIPAPLDDVLRLLASLNGVLQVFSELATNDPILLLELSLSIPEEIIDASIIALAWPGICALLASSSPVHRHVTMELCRRNAVRIRERL